MCLCFYFLKTNSLSFDGVLEDSRLLPLNEIWQIPYHWESYVSFPVFISNKRPSPSGVALEGLSSASFWLTIKQELLPHFPPARHPPLGCKKKHQNNTLFNLDCITNWPHSTAGMTMDGLHSQTLSCRYPGHTSLTCPQDMKNTVKNCKSLVGHGRVCL